MPIRQKGWRAFACLAMLMLAGSAGAATKVTITSPAGEILGGGVGTKTYTAPTATIDLRSTPDQVDVTIEQGGIELYRIWLKAPAGQTLMPGTYSAAEMLGDATGLAPSMRIHSQWGSCGDAWGSFVIRQQGPLLFGGPTEQLEATFSFRCDDPAAPALTGKIFIDAEPRYFGYSRDAGFPLGTATAKNYFGNNSETFLMGSSGDWYGYVSGQHDKWNFFVTAPDGKTLAKGIYPLAQNADPTHAGFSVIYNDDGYCDGLAGTLNVRNVTYDEFDQLTGMNATWTITCDGQPAAMRGTFHSDL
jgi:hypothetical protein